MPLTPYTGVLGKKHAAHLLRRATFAVSKAAIDSIAGLTPTQAIDILFRATPEPAPPVDPKTGVTWVDIPSTTANSGDPVLQGCVRKWALGVILGAGVSASDKLAFATREKIAFFLHTHYTTIMEVVGNSRASYYQNVLLRKYALDGGPEPYLNIKDLAKKISRDNAMIILLDGRLNVKGKPNENYARELFELFTIGKGLPGQIPDSTGEGDYGYFTEQDVQSAAKILSGYGIDDTFTTLDPDTNIPTGKIKLNASQVANFHDNSNKQFSFRFDNKVISPDPSLLQAGQPTEASVLDELDQLIEMIFEQEETARHICRKIYRFYVYHDITPQVESSIITEMATSLRANNYKIEPLIKELLTSTHFYDAGTSSVIDDQRGAIIKSPLDLVAQTLAFFEYELPDYTTNYTEFYNKTEKLLDMMEMQGMNFLNPFDVAGYDAYFQYPLFNRNWISANSLTRRYEFIHNIMTTESPMGINIDLFEYIRNNFSGSANDPDLLIRELASYLLPMSDENTEITTERLSYFKSRFFYIGTVIPQEPLLFWQFSWANADTIPDSKTDARGMLQDLINAMLQSPEYQLF
ncbi:MAG TPA: DUF1800 family protein [Cytophagaceae bacterium]